MTVALEETAHSSGASEFTPIFCGVLVEVAQWLVFCNVLCRSLFVFLSFFIWWLHCLSFFNLRLFTTHLTFHYLFGFFKLIKILHYFTLLLFFFIYFHHFFFSLWTIQDEKYCTLRTTFNLFLLQFYYRLCIFRVILVKDKGKYASLHCYCVMTLWPLLCFILFINLASKTVMIIMKLIEIVVIYCICLQRYKMYIF
jgi:hypothetical protein